MATFSSSRLIRTERGVGSYLYTEPERGDATIRNQDENEMRQKKNDPRTEESRECSPCHLLVDDFGGT